MARLRNKHSSIHPNICPCNNNFLYNTNKNPTHPYNKKIKQPIYAGALELGLAGVLHELGVLAGEHDDAVAPLRVAEHAAAQQDLVVVQREVLVAPAKRTWGKKKVFLSTAISSVVRATISSY